MPVRVNGTIDARLLPTPSVVLRDIEAGDGRGEARLKAGRSRHSSCRSGRSCAASGAPTELRLVQPEFALTLNRRRPGRLAGRGAQDRRRCAVDRTGGARERPRHADVIGRARPPRARQVAGSTATCVRSPARTRARAGSSPAASATAIASPPAARADDGTQGQAEHRSVRSAARPSRPTGCCGSSAAARASKAP